MIYLHIFYKYKLINYNSKAAIDLFGFFVVFQQFVKMIEQNCVEKSLQQNKGPLMPFSQRINVCDESALQIHQNHRCRMEIPRNCCI